MAGTAAGLLGFQFHGSSVSNSVALVRPDDDALQHVGEPGHRLDAVQLGGLDERHRNRPVTRPAIAPANNAFLR